MKQFIKIETLRSGQPKPYADSEYEYLVTFTIERQHGKMEIIPQTGIDIKRAIEVAKILCKFSERNDEGTNWASCFLNQSKKESEGVFRFNCTAEYTG